MCLGRNTPASSTPSTSRYPPGSAINLATGQNAFQSNQMHVQHMPSQSRSESPAANLQLAVRQPAPHLDQTRSPDLAHSLPYAGPYNHSHHGSEGSPLATFSTLDSQVNLATSSFAAFGQVSPNASYERSPGFTPPYGYSAFAQYDETPANSMDFSEIGANEATDFDYTYPESGPSPLPLVSGYTSQPHEPRASFEQFQLGSSESYFNAGSLGNFSFDNSQLAPLHIDIPESSFPDRRASEATVRLSSYHEHPFESVYTNVSVGSDTWSSATYSSPSLGSLSSSPSLQNNLSGSGTPFLGSEQPQRNYNEPLLSISQPSGPQRPLTSPSPSASSEPPVRPRRGAISNLGDLGRPMLEESIACQLYADDFQVETSTELTSPVSQFGTQVSRSNSFQAADSPSGSATSAHKPLKPTCADVMVGDSSTSRSRSSPNKSSDGPHYHPYARTLKMSEHEQVIQFDNVPAAHSSRKPPKRSRGSKRCYCTYICPVLGKQCDSSVSREADMGRHMHKHKMDEEEMITEGRLKPEDATNFGELKPTGATLCKGCKLQMSRKDALVRHLKKSGKACRIFYPDIDVHLK